MIEKSTACLGVSSTKKTVLIGSCIVFCINTVKEYAKKKQKGYLYLKCLLHLASESHRTCKPNSEEWILYMLLHKGLVPINQQIYLTQLCTIKIH